MTVEELQTRLMAIAIDAGMRVSRTAHGSWCVRVMTASQAKTHYQFSLSLDSAVELALADAERSKGKV